MKTQSFITKLIAITIVTFFLVSNWIFAEEKPAGTQVVKKKLAVIDFAAIGSGIDKELGKAIAELMRSCFIDTGKYIVIDKNSIDKTIQEKKITATEQTGIDLGKLLNTDFVVDGSIVKIGPSYILTGKIAEVKSAEVLRGKNLVGKSDDQLPDLVKQLVTMLIEPQETYSAKTNVTVLTTVSTTTTITDLNK
jgi:TolB-like protein